MKDEALRLVTLRTLQEQLIDLEALFYAEPKSRPELAPQYERLKRELTVLHSEVERLERLVYVPGVFQCAKCKMVLVSTTLNVTDGTAKANTEPQPCPNGCGPLWRRTERDAGNELCDRLDKEHDARVAASALAAQREAEIEVLRRNLRGEQDAHDPLIKESVDWQLRASRSV